MKKDDFNFDIIIFLAIYPIRFQWEQILQSDPKQVVEGTWIYSNSGGCILH